MSPSIDFYCHHFSVLSTSDLYEALALRIEVFAIEQQCIYQDADGKDYDSWHVIGKDNQGTIVAYARILPKGIAYQQYASIGRVVTRQSHRQTGLGKILMQHCMQFTSTHLPKGPIKISAQAYLIRFYEGFGFMTVGETYLEDGIPHIGMIAK
ncbi:MAG: GNAT family N-acetyltransferase [Bacteroidota bacterium]